MRIKILMTTISIKSLLISLSKSILESNNSWLLFWMLILEEFVVELLTSAGAASSRGDARRSIEGGGIYVNNRRVSDPGLAFGVEDAIDGRFLVLRKGKKSYFLVAVKG